MINKYKHIVYIFVVSAFALAYGQSIQELQKLKSEYEKFQKAQKELTIPSIENDPINSTMGLPRQAEIKPYKQSVDDFDNIPKVDIYHFGYDFFTRRDSLAFWENLPTPPNYLLGPGDKLVLSLWGETQLRQTYNIYRDGKIYDEKVGLLNLTGKSLKEARDYLKAQFGRVYSTLNAKPPSTFIDVSLGELRSINVNFVGQVKYPGVYPVHPFSTVITGIIQAGGIDITGSLRNIKIKRNGKVAINVDLYDYLLKGDLPENIQLRDQDIILIPVRSSRVKIDSAVVNPGIYESNEGESIFDLIQYAGGLTHNASDKIGISRIKSGKDHKIGSYYEGEYIDLQNAKLLSAQNVINISPRPLFKENKFVEIIGQVKVPGAYHYYKGMTFQDLIKLSGGFEDSTFWKSVYQDQAEIIRRDPSSRYEKVIKIDLRKFFNGGRLNNIQLQNLDRVVIHANLNYFQKENIQILGEVKIPGSYPILKDNESLQSFINRAGGFTEKAFEDGIEIYRDSLRLAWNKMSISLMPKDSVVIKERPGTIFVTGEVYNPSLVEFDPSKSLKNYINLAGGPTKNGDKNDIIIIYANGEVAPKKRMRTLKVKDGSTIVVNQKEIKAPFDMTAFASSLLSIISTTVTILVLSKQLNT